LHHVSSLLAMNTLFFNNKTKAVFAMFENQF